MTAKVESCIEVEDCPVFSEMDYDVFSNMDWWKAPIYAVDVETTGFSPTDDRIVEIGVSKYELDKKSFVSYKSFLINDGVPIPQALIDKQINDITNESLVGKPTFSEFLASGELDDALSLGSIWISHNRGFDFSFISNSLKRAGYSGYVPPIVCSLELAMKVDLGQPNNKLSTLRGILLDKHEEQSHRAGEDAMDAGNIFMALARKSPLVRSIRSTRELLEIFDNNPDI